MFLAMILQHARTALATAVVLAVPVFAAWSLLAASSDAAPARGETTGNASRWDSVEPPIAAVAPLPSRDSETEVVNNWTFVSKGKPSPYQ